MPRQQNYYEVLGLDAPPEDRKTVKRAYSKKLKVTRPEDDPDGFMRLREAHDIALNIIARQIAQAEWEAEQSIAETAAEPSAETEIQSPPNNDVETSELEATPNAGGDLTYADLLPQDPDDPKDPQDIEETTYSIGGSPSLEAPAHAVLQVSAETPPLLTDIETLLSSPKNCNDRDLWNKLFRKARDLDIDDYVDFENLLMDAILRRQGYFDRYEYRDAPETMPQIFAPSITASLFKTMNWDQIHPQGHRAHQIEWLSRRMQAHRGTANPVPVQQHEGRGVGHVWLWIVGAFVILNIIQVLAVI